MTERSRGNVAALAASQAFRLATGIGISIAVARLLGKEAFGILGFVTVVATVLSSMSSLGTFQLIAREVARDPDSAGARTAVGLWTTATLSIGFLLAVTGYVAVMDGRPAVVVAAVAAALAVGLESATRVPHGAFQGLRRMRLILPATLWSRTTYLLATIGALMASGGVIGVIAARVGAEAVGLATSLFLFRRRVGPIPPRQPPAEVARLARASVPFGLTLLFSGVYLNVDVLVIQEIHGEGEVGLYRAAALLFFNLLVVPQVVSTALFPRLARCVGDPDAAAREMSFAARVLLGLGLPVAVGGALVAEPFMVLVMGEQYREAAPVFALLMASLPLQFLINAVGTAASALDREGYRARLMAVTAALNLGSNLIAVPLYGATGAAATTFLTAVFLLVGLVLGTRAQLGRIRLAEPVLRAAPPALAMGAVVWVASPLHVVWQVLLGALVYAALGAATGAVTLADLRQLRRV